MTAICLFYNLETPRTLPSSEITQPRKTERYCCFFTLGKTYPQFQKIMCLEGEEEQESPKRGKCGGH